MKAYLKTSIDENKLLKTQNTSLKQQCESLAAEAKMHEQRIVQCEQYSRNANIEIKGIPLDAYESLQEIMEKLGDKIGDVISPSDIDAMHRTAVPGNASYKNIIAQFASRWKRDAVLEKAREARLSSEDFGFKLLSCLYQ